MEKKTKIIIVFSIIAVNIAGAITTPLIIVSIMSTLGFIGGLEPPNPYYTIPDLPPNVDSDFIIKIGLIGDGGQIVGDGAWEGAYLAAKEINDAGGIKIDNSQTVSTPNGRYYIGLTMEDSDEQNPTLVLSRSTYAASRLVYIKKAQFIIGGSRNEAVLDYTEIFMAAHKLFIGTGASDDTLTENVGNNYNKYKYFFRLMPTNETTYGTQIIYGIGTLQAFLNSSYAQNVTRFGLLYENLPWTEDLINALNNYLPAFGGTVVTNRPFDVGQTPTQMQAHINAFMAADCDIVIPIISGADSVLLAKQYAATQPNFMLIGIDIASQDSDFWGDSGGDCQYEIVSQYLSRTNKTTQSIAFWDSYVAQWGHSPIYTASGSYDAVKLLAYAINKSQTLSNDGIITDLEALDASNSITGTSGQIAFNLNHDLMGGWPYGTNLWAQWQLGGVKACIPSYSPIGTPAYYPSTLATGSVMVPPWIDTAWTFTPTH